MKIKRSGLLLYLELTLFQNVRLYVKNTGPKTKDAPSVFSDILASCLRSARKNIPRTTKPSLSSARKHAKDEMEIFLDKDKLDFGKIIDQASEKFNCVTVYSHKVGSVSI